MADSLGILCAALGVDLDNIVEDNYREIFENHGSQPCCYEFRQTSFEYLLPYHERMVFRKRYRRRSDSKFKGEFLRNTKGICKDYDKLMADD